MNNKYTETELIEEIRRVKKQRNAYEQELLLANRRLLKMKVELEIEREKRLQEDNLSKEPISSYANKKILEELNWLWTIFDEAKEHGAANVILGRIKEYEKILLGKKEPVSEDELEVKFIEAITDEFGNLMITPLVNKCAQIAKQYSDSKLEEIEKWCDEEIEFCLQKMKNNDRMFWDSKSSAFNEVKSKIQSLK